MTRRHFITLGVLLIAIAGAAALYGQGQRGQDQPQDRGDWFRQLSTGKLQERLKLSPEQVASLKEISAGQRMKFLELSATVAQRRQALFKQIFSEKPNQSEIEKCMDALNEAQVAQMEQLASTAGEMNKVLSPEQRAEFLRVIDEGAKSASLRRERFRQRLMQPAAPPDARAPEPEER